MNPLWSSAIGAILRWALAMGAGWLVEHGIWTSSDASTYVTAASLGLLSIGWSLWRKYTGRVKLLTALSLSAGTSENDLKDHIRLGLPMPSLNTKPDDSTATF